MINLPGITTDMVPADFEGIAETLKGTNSHICASLFLFSTPALHFLI